MILYIPGFLIGWLTFPGIIIHELAHKLACDWRGVRVFDVTWFSLSGRGEVRHAQPHHPHDTIAISVAPFVFNTILAAICYTIAFLIYAFQNFLPPMTFIGGLILGWLGLSIGWHAFPSRGDAKNVWRVAKQHWRSSILATLAFPAVVIIYIANLLSFFWFDAIYSLAIGFIVLLILSGLGIVPSMGVI